MNLETHLNELPEADAADFRNVVGRLRDMPQREPSADLADRILAAVAEEQDGAARAPDTRPCGWKNRAPWRIAAALAAGLVAVVTLFALREPAAPEDGLAWLAACQEADGTWNPARHGGDASYRPALTALAALALSRESERHAARVGRACDALAALQTADGAFGGGGRVQAYNHVIATCALAELGSRLPHVKTALERAVAFSDSRQSAEGGWDYEAGSEGNTAVTAWQVRALACAAEQGISEANIPLRKGLRWLRGAARDDGSVAYHRDSGARSEGLSALTAHALMTSGKSFPGLSALGQRVAASLGADPGGSGGADCYRDYAKVLAFESAGEGGRANAVRGGMLERRQTGGHDQWEKVGGTLYTQTFTALVAKR